MVLMAYLSCLYKCIAQCSIEVQAMRDVLLNEMDYKSFCERTLHTFLFTKIKMFAPCGCAAQSRPMMLNMNL